MAQLIPTNLFTGELFLLLEETFENTHGIYLDKNTSLFDTLKQLSAEDASRSLLPGGTTIAAHVEHVRFYLDVLERDMQGKDVPAIDWKESWKVTTVSPAEWDNLLQRLRDQYQRLNAAMKSYEDWSGADQLGGALSIVVHTAYHLGAIRQILTVVKK